jgi:hypothetical protein
MGRPRIRLKAFVVRVPPRGVISEYVILHSRT